MQRAIVQSIVQSVVRLQLVRRDDGLNDNYWNFAVLLYNPQYDAFLLFRRMNGQ